ncbi:MAG: hypothetical protein CMF59_14660 [Leptospiraceae bacterium]|nr:hypothetical protein [Leptospiraceae bacterium]
MEPVWQTEWEGGRGNALQACIASIMEQELAAVPNFIEAPDYLDSLNQFLSQYRMAFLKVTLESGRLPFPADGILCVLAGPSPRGSHRHIIVARTSGVEFQPLHDPHPAGGNLAGDPVWAGFILPLDPLHRDHPESLQIHPTP